MAVVSLPAAAARKSATAEAQVLMALAVAAALVLGACGAGSGGPPRQAEVAAGQLTPAEMPSHDVLRRAAAAAAVTTTIPLATQDPTTAFFTAIQTFQSCLSARGVKFVGAPDPSNPASPANDPNYLKNLEVCAAQSNILQAMKNAQAAQADMTPAQIAAENKGYLKFRTCLIGRGWKVPLPTPDAQGRLFSFGGGGGGGGSGPQLTPPPGQSILSSPDIRACASQAGAGRKAQGG